MTRTYSKPALTYQQQIAHLRGNGMVIADEASAEYWLRHVSYYRLSAYWLYFEHPKGSAGPRFKPGTTFEAVTALYDFDRILRRLTMRGTEHVEVALRGLLAYFQIGRSFQFSGNPIERIWPIERVSTSTLTRSGKVVSGL